MAQDDAAQAEPTDDLMGDEEELRFTFDDVLDPAL